MKLLCTISLLLLLSLLTTRSQAQSPQPASPEKSRKFFVGLSLGPSFPTGKFAGKNYQDTTAGLAQPGPALAISGGYMFTRSIGAVLLVGGQINKTDAGAIASGIAQRNGDTVRTEASAHNWKSARLMGGMVFKLPLTPSGKLSFQARILAGALKTSVPGYSYSMSLPAYGNFPYETGTKGDVSLNWAFCYQATTGLSWKLSKRISLVGDISYYHADTKHHYDHYLHFSPGGTFYDSGPWDLKYSISSVNLSAGAEISF